MKPLALVAALALALMVAGCMHEQPQLGGATAGAGFVPIADWLTRERDMAWFGVIILMALIWIVLDV